MSDEQLAAIKSFVDGGEMLSLRNCLAMLDHIDTLQAALAAAAERAERIEAQVAGLREALDRAGKDFVAGHYHLAERGGLSDSEHDWLADHLEASFGRVCDALAPAPSTTRE